MAAPTEPSTTQWGLGLAVGSIKRPYRGVGNDTKVLPLVYVENAWVRVFGAGAQFKLHDWQLGAGPVALRGLLEYEGDGYKPGDSPALAGMQERKGGVWAGASISWDTQLAKASLGWTADLSGNSKGQQLQLQLDRRFGFGRFALTPRVQATWFDRKYVDYYYGVQASEASSGRPAYAGESATTLGLGVRMDYRLTGQQTMFLDVGMTSLPNEIKNSPIVERSSQTRVGIGYLYRF